jgi:tripartite-type tricarboxylate transporter receptor subunit TctC
VQTSLKVDSVAELLDLLRKNPGKYNYGSIGNGSLSHLAMEALALKSGTTMVHVPYAGSPQAMTALLRNDVQMACLPAISAVPHVASGQIKILAVSLGRRSALLPGVPTLKEVGLDVEADAWNGLIAPAKTPEPIITQIHDAAVDALREPLMREKLAAQFMEPIPTTPAQFRAKIDADLARWTRPAEPVDRAVAADQRRGSAVADQRVVFDSQRHGSLPVDASKLKTWRSVRHRSRPAQLHLAQCKRERHGREGDQHQDPEDIHIGQE